MSPLHSILALLAVTAASAGLSIGLTFAPCYSSLCSEDFAAFETRIHIAVYYALLLTLLGIFFLRLKVTAIRTYSEKPLFKRRLPLLKARVTWGGVLITIWILFVVLVTTALWLKIKPFINGLVAGLQDAKDASVSFTITSIIGHHIDLILGLVIIPVPRHSTLCTAFGFPASTLLWAHKGLAYLLLIGAIAHGAAYMSFIAAWQENTTAAKATISILNPYWPEAAQTRLGHYALANFPTGILLIVLQVIIAITALSWIRRRHYELFYYCHIALGILFLVAACIHASTNFYALVPGLFLWTYDVVWRFVGGKGLSYKQSAIIDDAGNGWYRVTVLAKCKPIPDTASEKTVTASEKIPLQHYHLNIPVIDKVQCHPLSTTTAATSDGEVQFLLRAGPSEKDWASRLTHLSSVEAQSVTARLEGPYISNTSTLTTASQIICIVGGTGITGALSIADWWQHSASSTSQHLTIIWTVRDEATAQLSEWKQLCALAMELPTLHIQTHCSSKSGRLDMSQALRSGFDDSEQRIWVYVSGPESLLDQGEDACLDLSRELRRDGKKTAVECHAARWEV